MGVDINAAVKLLDAIFVFFSAKERERRYKLILKIKKDKALNLAEEMFDLTEEIFKFKPSNIRDAKIRKWQGMRKKFNKLD